MADGKHTIFGGYPKGYNRAIHGSYDPGRFYGKPDTPFGEVKLAELPAWFSRRSLNPFDWVSACSRFYWRWQHKWMHPKKAGAVSLYQMGFCLAVFMYTINYQKHWDEKNYKYH